MFLSSILMLMLASGPANAAAPNPVPATDPLEKVECRRETATGSLMDGPKICHTKREWRRMANDAQDEARRLIPPTTMANTGG